MYVHTCVRKNTSMSYVFSIYVYTCIFVCMCVHIHTDHSVSPCSTAEEAQTQQRHESELLALRRWKEEALVTGLVPGTFPRKPLPRLPFKRSFKGDIGSYKGHIGF